jgi:hypothetical protein
VISDGQFYPTEPGHRLYLSILKSTGLSSKQIWLT